MKYSLINIVALCYCRPIHLVTRGAFEKLPHKQIANIKGFRVYQESYYQIIQSRYISATEFDSFVEIGNEIVINLREWNNYDFMPF